MASVPAKGTDVIPVAPRGLGDTKSVCGGATVANLANAEPNREDGDVGL